MPSWARKAGAAAPAPRRPLHVQPWQPQTGGFNVRTFREGCLLSLSRGNLLILWDVWVTCL